MLKQGPEDVKKINVTTKLPDGWRWVRLGEVCEFLDSQRKPINENERRNRIKGKDLSMLYPYYGANGQVGWIDDYLFDEPLILLAEDGGFFGSSERAISYAVTGKYWVNNHAHVLRPREHIVFDYCLIALAIRPDVGNLVTGNTRPKLNQAIAAMIPIPLPPLPEQKRIAAILNEQMAAVENARAAAEAQLKAAKALPLAFLRQVFYGTQAQRWPIMKFEDVAFLQRGYDLPAHRQVPGDYTIMTSSGYAGTHIEYRAKGPGVITGRSGSVGKVHYIEKDYWPHNTTLFIKDFRGNEPRFIFYLLQSIGLKDIGSGSGVPTLDRKQVHKLQVRCPVHSEQRRIAAILDEQMTEAEKLRKSVEDQLETMKPLPAALLRQAFSGEL